MTLRPTARINPRTLIAAVSEAARQASLRKAALRSTAICMAGVVGLMSFGTIVVRANDDNGALAFIRTQARPQFRAPQPVYRPAPAPTAYFAPRGFFQIGPAPRRPAHIVASYAPFAAFVPPADSTLELRTRRTAGDRNVARVRNDPSFRVALPAPERGKRTESGIPLGTRITYCVRTCDGFFFPLSQSTNSDRGDEAACNNLCPATQTRVFYGTLGSDIDDARARDNGRRYASMANAFSYRRSLDKDCSCSAEGPGLAQNRSLLRDGTLRPGDVVMTPRGMKVFSGGSYPYREANFTALERSNLVEGRTRANLQRVEQASLPGRSGISASRQTAQPRRSNELKELAAAQRSVEKPTSLVRYVGPDVSARAR
jgi:Protein of unknown function (DUF2865)